MKPRLMKRLSEEVKHFLQTQGFVIVSSIDSNGFSHSSCKGLIKIDPRGKIYLLDLYRGETFQNLKSNPRITITAVDEHKFIGYCLKGKAEMLNQKELQSHIIKAWESRITGRLTQRLLKNIREEKGNTRHPEILLPKPEYMIVMEVEEIIDLTPHHIKQGV